LTTNINTSILNKNNFRLIIDKIPTVEYYVRSVNIPGLQFTEVETGAGVGVDAFFPGDKVSFDNLEVQFLVDEDLENFKEVYDWMNAIIPIKDPSDFENYVETVKTPTGRLSAINNDLNQYSMITLVMNTNKNIPNKFLRFYDCFPTGISGMELESGSETEPVVCTATFRFTYYDIETTS
jgi:hypothetical protein